MRQIEARSVTSGKLESLVDDRFGPFANFQTFKTLPGWWISSCSIARAPTGNCFGTHAQTAAGASLHKEEALIKALGEAAERFSGLQSVHHDTIFLRRWQDSQYRDVLPCVGRLGNEQDVAEAIDPNSYVSHTTMIEALSNKSVEIPSAIVHLGANIDKEPLVTHPISTGLAFHTNLELALLSGVREVLERDALMICWMYPHLTRRIVAIQDLEHLELGSRLEKCANYEIECTLTHINVDLVVAPIIMCVLKSERFPRFVVGTGSASSIAEACVKSIDEAMSIRLFCEMNQSRSNLLCAHATQPSSLEDHALLYAGRPTPDAFQPFDDAGEVTLANLASEWAQEGAIAQDFVEAALRLHPLGLTVLWKEITAKEVCHIGRAIRIVIPQALPLSQTHAVRWLGTPRLQILAKNYLAEGREPRALSHPFS